MASTYTIGTEFLVNSTIPQFQQNSAIAASGSGGFLIVWEDQSAVETGDSRFDIHAQFYDADRNPVGDEILVNSTQADIQISPSVTALDNGNYVVTWTDFSATLGDTSHSAVHAQIFTSTGARVGDEFLVNTVTSEYQQIPTVTALHDGGSGFLIIWDDTSQSVRNVHAQIFSDVGQKLGDEFSVSLDIPGSQYVSKVAAFSDGGFVVVWKNDHNGSITTRLFDATGNPQTGNLDVPTTPHNGMSDPNVAVLSNGNFVITWEDPDSTDVHAQVFSRDANKIGTEFLVNSYTAYTQNTGRVVGLDGGGFVVVWTDSSGQVQDVDVKGQLYTNTGQKVGYEFLINSTTFEKQQVPSIAALPGGGFVTAWDDWSDIYNVPSATNIKAQVWGVTFPPIVELLADTGGSPNDRITSNGELVLSGVLSGALVEFSSDGGTTWASSFTAADGQNEILVRQTYLGNTSDAGPPFDFILDTTVPVITTGADQTLVENTTLVANLTTSDPNTAGTITATFSITGGADGALFDIVGGQLVFRIAPDFEVDKHSYEVEVTASDLANSSSQTITVSLTNAAGVTITGTSGANTISATQTVAGQPLPTQEEDVINGGGGNDTIYALGGNDTINGGTGADVMVGGLGDDTYVVDNVGDVVTELANEGLDTVLASISLILSANVENLTLTGVGNIKATGNALDNILIGNTGNNTLTGDVGSDAMTGGAGNDIYVVDNTGDQAIELLNEGTDTVQSSIDFTLPDNVENLTLTGSTAVLATGNALNNAIIGNNIGNVIDGGLGADTMTGGLGDDVFFVDNSADVVKESAGGGNDLIVSSISYSATANVEKLTLSGSAAINATGNALANTLLGNSGDNVLNGLTGADSMTGGDGNDTYFVDNLGDVVVELANQGTDLVNSSISYTLAAEVENLTLTGTASISGTGNELDNVITGNAGANTLRGGLGADTLVGGAGNDALYGGAGSDTFSFAAGFGKDTIWDFDATSPGHDLISFASGMFGNSAAAVLAASTQVGANVVITLDATDTITIKSVTLGALSASDFWFG